MHGAVVLGLLKAVTLALLGVATLLYLLRYIEQLLTDPNALLPLMLQGVGLCLIWLLVAFASRRR